MKHLPKLGRRGFLKTFAAIACLGATLSKKLFAAAVKAVQGYLIGNEDENAPYFLVAAEQIQAGESLDLTTLDLIGHDTVISTDEMQKLKAGQRIEVTTSLNSHVGEPKAHSHIVVFDPNT